MFVSKFDKGMCWTVLMLNFAYFDWRHGIAAAAPFLACAVLTIGMSTQERQP